MKAEQRQSNEAWHAESVDQVLARLESASELGLSSEEAAKRLRQFGANTVTKKGGESAFRILLRQVQNPLIYVLLASTALAILMGKTTDGIVVFGVVVLNTVIGFVQEYQAGKAIQALLAMVPEYATVLRDGAQKSVPSAELVPGDRLVIQAGDRISADARLVQVKNLQCDESALTGESVPVLKLTAPVAAYATIGDRKCMAFSGTLVTSGAGSGIVVTTGSNTEFGRISQLLEQTTSLKTPLTESLERLARLITFAILIVGTLLFGVGLLRGYGLLDATLSAITLAVAAIPEGLPAIVTIASAVGVKRMARRRAVIRHLPAVETLGSTTVICSDKTGTLTLNRMTVQSVWTPGESEKKRSETIRAGVLCSDASSESGDPTEVALVVAGKRFGFEEKELRREYRRLDVVPFSSERKLMATLHETPAKERVTYLKGAPESVIRTCSASDPGVRAAAETRARELSARGMRVIAMAARKEANSKTSLSEQDLEAGFELLGLEAMIDPPRDEAKDAIRACREAGVSVKMITGDHPETARAIGRALGLDSSDRKSITGVELEKMNDEELARIVRESSVFARVAPEHKLRLVKALQDQQQVVAMTGDGVNDAPALKRADIGVAMGITGTAVAKESSDMILTDDNFASIAAAVEEGRRVYDNLMKAIAFVLPTSVAQGLVILVAILFFPVAEGAHLRPLEPVQALWVNLVTSVSLAIPLAFEAMEPDVMRRPPRKKDAPIFSRFMIFRLLLVSVLISAGTVGLFLWEYFVELKRGAPQNVAYTEAQTMAVNTIVFFQVFYLLNCRSLKHSIFQIGLFTNPLIFVGILLTVLAQLAFVYLPFMNEWFHSHAIKLEAWLYSLAVAFLIFPIIALEKRWRATSVRSKAGEQA